MLHLGVCLGLECSSLDFCLGLETPSLGFEALGLGLGLRLEEVLITSLGTLCAC